MILIIAFVFILSPNFIVADEESKTCENRGIWLENKGLFGCFCTGNFWGAWCQFTCNNGDLRQYESGEFFCECAKGYAGSYCERRLHKGFIHKLHEKLSEDCQNNGFFVSSKGECRCPMPFFGAYCQFSCGNGRAKIWKSKMNVQGVIDKVWETLFGPDSREDKARITPAAILSLVAKPPSDQCSADANRASEEPLIDPSLLGAVAADNFLDYFHANTAKYYCDCDPGFFGLNCEYSAEQPRIPTITIRPIQTRYDGQSYASVDESVTNDDYSLNAKLGIGFSVILLLGLVAMFAAFWYCKKRDDVIVRYVTNPAPRRQESPRLQKSDIVKVVPPPAYQYEDHTANKKKYSDDKFAF